jgi:hypothetical protein
MLHTEPYPSHWKEPRRIVWAGFASNTHKLMAAGWEILVNKVTRNVRLIMKSRDIIATTKYVRAEDYYNNAPWFNLEVVALNTKISETIIASSYPDFTFFNLNESHDYIKEGSHRFNMESLFGPEVFVSTANKTVLDHLEAIKKLQVEKVAQEAKNMDKSKQIVLAKVIGI